MGKFLPLPINAFLDVAHFFVELGVSTDKENRSYPIKPNLRKLFIVDDTIKKDLLFGHQRLAIYPKEVIINKDIGHVHFNNEFIFYYDFHHIGFHKTADKMHPHLKYNSTFSLTYDIIECVKAKNNVYINNEIGRDLTTIFKHFKIDEDLIDSFILLSIVLVFKVFKEHGKNYNKPTNDEKELIRVLNEFIDNSVVKKCKKTLEKINSINEFKAIKDKVFNYKVLEKKEFLTSNKSKKSSRKSKTKFGITPLVRDQIKEIFIAFIFVFYIRNNVNLSEARKLGYYILAYFNFIEEFSDSKEFNNQYDSSYFKNVVICKSCLLKN